MGRETLRNFGSTQKWKQSNNADFIEKESPEGQII
jgi:hypothetical protein